MEVKTIRSTTNKLFGWGLFRLDSVEWHRNIRRRILIPLKDTCNQAVRRHVKLQWDQTLQTVLNSLRRSAEYLEHEEERVHTLNCQGCVPNSTCYYCFIFSNDDQQMKIKSQVWVEQRCLAYKSSLQRNIALFAPSLQQLRY